jgi:hypothetical protein
MGTNFQSFRYFYRLLCYRSYFTISLVVHGCFSQFLGTGANSCSFRPFYSFFCYKSYLSVYHLVYSHFLEFLVVEANSYSFRLLYRCFIARAISWYLLLSIVIFHNLYYLISVFITGAIYWLLLFFLRFLSTRTNNCICDHFMDIFITGAIF